MATEAKSENRLYDHISPCKEKVITVVKIAVTRFNSEWLHGYFLLTGLSKMDFFVSDSPDNHVCVSPGHQALVQIQRNTFPIMKIAKRYFIILWLISEIVIATSLIDSVL